MADNPPETQLNIRIAPEQDAMIREAAARELRTKAGFSRILFFWAWGRYREAGTLQKLLAATSSTPQIQLEGNHGNAADSVQKQTEIAEGVYERVVRGGGHPKRRKRRHAKTA